MLLNRAIESGPREACMQSQTRRDPGRTLESFSVKVSDDIENWRRRERMNSGSTSEEVLSAVLTYVKAGH